MLTYGTEITRSHIEHYIIEVNYRGNNVVHQAQFVLCIVFIYHKPLQKSLYVFQCRIVHCKSIPLLHSNGDSTVIRQCCVRVHDIIIVY